MIRRFNLREVDLNEYSFLCKLLGISFSPTAIPEFVVKDEKFPEVVTPSMKFFQLKDWIYYESIGELAKDFPSGGQYVQCLWMPGERKRGDARYMTHKNPDEYFAELDSKKDEYEKIAVSTSKRGNKTDKRKDHFDFVRKNSGWALMSFRIRGYNVDCYNLNLNGRVMRKEEILSRGHVIAVFGD